jgi:hypothetical protein
MNTPEENIKSSDYKLLLIEEKKIVASFGVDFYEKIRGDLEKYAELWELSDFEAIDNYTWSVSYPERRLAMSLILISKLTYFANFGVICTSNPPIKIITLHTWLGSII